MIDENLWSIKYAPQNIRDAKVNISNNLVEKLINMQKGVIPHMIFNGPPGCGKMTFASLFSRHRLKNASESIKIITAETKITKDENKEFNKLRYKHYETSSYKPKTNYCT